jgi:hypothetical protein
MSLPIFAASTTRAHLEQVLVVVLIFAPLLVVIVNRLRQGRWTDLPAEQRNEAWTAPATVESSPPEAAPPRRYVVDTRLLRAAPVIAVAALIAWIAASKFNSEAPPITVSRTTAEAAARQALSQAGYTLDASWTVLARINAQPDREDRFVWQTRGQEGYATLLGTFIDPPGWLVRFARFSGDVAERAEEYQVFLAGDGRPFRIRHQLPEARSGPTLAAGEARTLALSAIDSRYQMAPPDISEVSAEARKRPSRGDWTLQFKDTRDYGLAGGELRIGVDIAGDQVADANRYVHVPEEWARKELAQRSIPQILSALTQLFTVGILLAGAVMAVIYWSQSRQFAAATALKAGAVVLALNLIAVANLWQSSRADFSTAQPYGLQAGIVLAASVVSALVIAGTLALVAGFVRQAAWQGPRREAWIIGIAAGSLLSVTRTAAAAFVPSLGPTLPDFSAAGAVLPVVAAALGPVSSFVIQVLLITLIFYFVDRASAGWLRRSPSAFILLAIAGLLMAGARGIETITSWLIGGAIIAAVLTLIYVLLLRHAPRAVIPMAATMSVLGIAKEALQRAHPAALTGGIAAAIIVLFLASAAMTKYHRRGTQRLRGSD